MRSRLGRELTGHDLTTVPDAGWAATRNGELLALAEKRFDAFLTVDRNLSFQQPLPKFRISVVLVRAPTTACAISCRSRRTSLRHCHWQSTGK